MNLHPQLKQDCHVIGQFPLSILLLHKDANYPWFILVPDRIGQAENIKIHVPYLLRSAQQIMYQWYHEGLNAFEKTCPVGHNVYSQVKDTLIEALHQIDDGLADLPQLIDTTRLLNEQLLSAIQQGRNRLLEYNS